MLAGAAALLLTACGNSMPLAAVDPVQPPDPDPEPPIMDVLVSAHQGGARYAPDDTMTAFVNAVRLGVDELEMDTFLTADGRLVIVHDETLDRTTNCSGDVSTLNLDQIVGCDAAYWWEPGQGDTRDRPGIEHPLRGQGITISTADEVFAYVASLGPDAPRINIELKLDTQQLLAERTSAALVALIQGSGLKERVVVQSFLPWALDLVRLQDPDIRLSFLVGISLQGVTGVTSCLTGALLAIASGYDIYSPEFDFPDFNETCVQLAKTFGLEVLPWTVDNEDDLKHMLELGVDGVITNSPACLLRLLHRPVPENVLPPGVFQPANFPICALDHPKLAS
jgi:glycerophosphoryl diester phosphodiesterase